MGWENGKGLALNQSGDEPSSPPKKVDEGTLFKALTDLHGATIAQHDKSFGMLIEAHKDSTERMVRAVEGVQNEVKSQGRVVLGLAVLGMLGVLALAGARLSGALKGIGDFDVGEGKPAAIVEEANDVSMASPVHALQR